MELAHMLHGICYNRVVVCLFFILFNEKNLKSNSPNDCLWHSKEGYCDPVTFKISATAITQESAERGKKEEKERKERNLIRNITVFSRNSIDGSGWSI